jgi:hypothetical protein
VFAEWRARRVGIDYHVDVDKHHYSVPHSFARQEVEVRLTGRTVEVFANGERIAAHLAWATSCRNHGRHQIGTPERLQRNPHVALRRQTDVRDIPRIMRTRG